MGTRAAFWKGDPRDLDNREWLGCIAFDGYPEGTPSALIESQSEDEFLAEVNKMRTERGFARPQGGWPYPWNDDVFLTDYTYAWFDGRVNISKFHYGFISADDAKENKWREVNDPTCVNVPSGKPYDNSQPDSIIIFRV